ncbi:hypothetical protein EDF62_1582 [Leucobacter luti]|uniref:LPXTG-motif cell wall-anchored protein n=1 Tax=Leucobacter luti TaxID=340320 RepID=A0A4R6S174_9MICO|nr:hypothetical protein [Leucobacter luti]TDP92375.1 hypothetical protein EDF62_1582 [Leucobacter luti]
MKDTPMKKRGMLRSSKVASAAGVALALTASIALPQAAYASGQVDGVAYKGVEASGDQVGFWSVDPLTTAVPLDSETPAGSGYAEVKGLAGAPGYGAAQWAYLNAEAVTANIPLVIPGSGAGQWGYETGAAGEGSKTPYVKEALYGVSAGIISDQFSEDGKSSLDTFDWSAADITPDGFEDMAKKFNEGVGDDGTLVFSFDKKSYSWSNQFLDIDYKGRQVNDSRPQLLVNGKPAPHTPVQYHLTAPAGMGINSPLIMPQSGWITVRTDANGYVPIDVFAQSANGTIKGEMRIPSMGCELNEYSHDNGTRVVGTECAGGQADVVPFSASVTVVPAVEIDTPPAAPYMECGVAYTHSASNWNWYTGIAEKDGEPAIELEARFNGKFGEVYTGPPVENTYLKLSELEASKAECAPVLVEAKECGIEATVETPERYGIAYDQTRADDIITVTARYSNGSSIGGRILEKSPTSDSYTTATPKPSYWSWTVQIPPIEKCFEAPKVTTKATGSAVKGDLVYDIATVTGDVPEGSYLLFDVYAWSGQGQRPAEPTIKGEKKIAVDAAGEFTSEGIKLDAGSWQWFATLYDADGKVIAEDQWGVDSERSEVTEPPLVAVTPVAPQQVIDTECGVVHSVSSPQVEGVTYTQTREGDHITVTATALEGYVFADGAQSVWEFDLQPDTPCLDPETEVTPVAPELIKSAECSVEDTVSTPQAEGVTYAQSREGNKVTVKATPLDGYVFADGATAEWTFEIPAAEQCPEPAKEVTPVAPVLVPATACGVEGTIAVAETEGVSYAQTREGNKVTVKATALEGYVFAEGVASEWTVEIPATEKCEPTKPVDPKPTDPKEPTEPKRPVDPVKSETVDKTNGTLARTGGVSAGLFVGLGGALLAAGAAAFFIGRKRSSA